MVLQKSALATAVIIAITTAAGAGEYDARLSAIMRDQIVDIAKDPIVIATLRRQNVDTAAYDAGRIEQLDTIWRQQVVQGGEMIDGYLARPASQRLRDVKQAAQGLYSELFVSDAQGLNAALSDTTSDYWQGDEAKWQVPHDTNAPHFGEVAFDDSSQSYQSQVSVPVYDPNSQQFLGVLTVGVNLEILAEAN